MRIHRVTDVATSVAAQPSLCSQLRYRYIIPTSPRAATSATPVDALATTNLAAAVSTPKLASSVAFAAITTALVTAAAFITASLATATVSNAAVPPTTVATTAIVASTLAASFTTVSAALTTTTFVTAPVSTAPFSAAIVPSAASLCTVSKVGARRSYHDRRRGLRDLHDSLDVRRDR